MVPACVLCINCMCVACRLEQSLSGSISSVVKSSVEESMVASGGGTRSMKQQKVIHTICTYTSIQVTLLPSQLMLILCGAHQLIIPIMSQYRSHCCHNYGTHFFLTILLQTHWLLN